MRAPFKLFTAAVTAVAVGLITVGTASIASANEGEAPLAVDSSQVESLVVEAPPEAVVEAPEAETPPAPAEDESAAEALIAEAPADVELPAAEPASSESQPDIAEEVAPANQQEGESPGAAPAAQMMSFNSAPAYDKEAKAPKKVWVCKFVGTPGVNERLKSGKNPISVSINSIANNTWDGTVPGWFSDAHDRSFVIAYDNGGPGPSRADCGEEIEPPAPVKDASFSVSVMPATCDAPAKLVYGTAVHANVSGTADGTTGPAAYNVTATSTEGHLFADGDNTEQFSGSLDGVKPTQSTNPAGDCYKAPEPPVKPEPYAGFTEEVDSVECLAAGGGTVNVTITPWTQDWVLNTATNTWELGEKVNGTSFKTTRTASKVECPPTEKPEVPEPKVTETDWVDGEWTCGDVTVTQTRTVTTTPYKVVDVNGKWEVVEDTENISSVEQTQPRDLTEEELETCEEPPVKPEPYAGYDTSEEKPECLVDGGGIVKMTVTPWTQGWILNEETNTWELGEKVYGEPFNTTRNASKVECPPVVTPPVDKPEPPHPTNPPASEAPNGDLPNTGASDSVPLIAGGLGLLVLGSVLLLRRRRLV